MENDTNFYGDFTAKISPELSGVLMEKTVVNQITKNFKFIYHKIFIKFSLKVSLSILFPYYFHNFYIFWRLNIFPV